MLFTISFIQAQAPLWKRMLLDIPHDVGALVAYALIAGFIGFIWVGNRKRSS